MREGKCTCDWLFSSEIIFACCIYICVYKYECILMHLIHILLQGLEKKLKMWTGVRSIPKCSLTVKTQ